MPKEHAARDVMATALQNLRFKYPAIELRHMNRNLVYN